MRDSATPCMLKQTQCRCCLCTSQSNLLLLRASVFPPPSGPLGAPEGRGPPSWILAKWSPCCWPRPGGAGRPSCGQSELWGLRRAADIQSSVQFGGYLNRRTETTCKCVDVNTAVKLSCRVLKNARTYARMHARTHTHASVRRMMN